MFFSFGFTLNTFLRMYMRVGGKLRIYNNIFKKFAFVQTICHLRVRQTPKAVGCQKKTCLNVQIVPEALRRMAGGLPLTTETMTAQGICVTCTSN